jgi:chromosome segregation ATPase
MESQVEESIVNHSVAISRIEDCEDDMNICKGDIDAIKIEQVSMGWDIRMSEASMGSAHEQLKGLGDRIDSCYAETWRTCSLSETNNRLLGLEIQRVQRETCGDIESLFQKFEKVNDIINKKVARQDEEMDRVVELVGQRIDTKMGEFSSDLMEALEIEENRRKDLKAKVSGLEERLEHTLAHVANLATLLLSVQSCVSEVEDAMMADTDEDAEEEVLSSSSDLDPVENMVAIPIPAPSIIHMLVEIPEEFVPPILQSSSSVPSTPSPEYVQVLEEDLSHSGVPEYWADPEVSDD